MGGLTPGHADYFEGEVARGREDYYAGRGEAPGQWRGTGAAEAGLSGLVEAGDLAALFQQRHPDTGEPLGAEYKVSATYIDRFGNEQTRHKRAANDATFSVPKSMSEIFAVGSDAQKQQVLDALDVAIDAAVDHLETHGAFSRTGKGGLRQIDTEGLVVASYVHRTSRAGDPQIHAHLLVSNRVHCGDGQWRALDGRPFRRELKTAGMIGQAVLRAEMESHGYVWGPVSEHGQAEILGVPKELMALHSKRTRQVEQHANAAIRRAEDALGRTLLPAERAEKFNDAAVSTRAVKSKKHQPLERLHDRWYEEASDAGFDPAEWMPDVFNQQRTRTQELSDRDLIEGALSELGRTKSVWDRTDATRIIARTIPTYGAVGADIQGRVEGLVDSVMGDREAIRITIPEQSLEGGPVRADGQSVYTQHNSAKYTTGTNLAREQRVLERAERHDRPIGVAPKADVVAVLDGLAEAGEGLSADQVSAVAQITQAGEPIAALVGPAGAGKSRTVGAVADIYARSDTPVRGLTVSAVAAGVLRDAGVGNADTIAKFLHEQNRESGPRPDFQVAAGEIIFIDEASMATNHQLDAITGIAEKADAKVVVVGDYRQLGAIEAGGLFRLLANTGTAAELDQIWRFENEWEGPGSLQLRDGDTAVLDLYETHGRITAGTEDEMVDKAFDFWLDARNDGASAIVTAPDRATVAAFNDRARAHLTNTGHYTSQPVSVGGLEIAEGEELLTLRNDRTILTSEGQFVRNGDRWAVDRINPKTGSIEASSLTGQGTVTLPADYTTTADNLGYSYAATTTKAQGATVNRSATIANHASDAQSLYVGATRGEETNQLFVVTEPELSEFAETGPAPTAKEVLAQAMGRDRAQRSATETIRQTLDQLEPAQLDTPTRPEPEKPKPAAKKPPAERKAGTPGRDEVLAGVDLSDLADELLGPAQIDGESKRWASPVPGHVQAGKKPPTSIFETKYGEQRWTCFETGKSGTAVDLVMTAKNLDYQDSIAWLTQRNLTQQRPAADRSAQTAERAKPAPAPVELLSPEQLRGLMVERHDIRHRVNMARINLDGIERDNRRDQSTLQRLRTKGTQYQQNIDRLTETLQELEQLGPVGRRRAKGEIEKQRGGIDNFGTRLARNQQEQAGVLKQITQRNIPKLQAGIALRTATEADTERGGSIDQTLTEDASERTRRIFDPASPEQATPHRSIGPEPAESDPRRQPWRQHVGALHQHRTAWDGHTDPTTPETLAREQRGRQLQFKAERVRERTLQRPGLERGL